MSISRRQFLATTTAAGLSLGTQSEAAWLTRREKPQAASATPADVHIQPWNRPLVGSQLYGWGQYYQREHRDVNQDEIFAALRAAGYDYAEGNLDVQDHGANARFSQRLRQHGLVPVSLYTGGAFHQTGTASQTARRIAEAAQSAKRQGFEIIVCNPDPIGRDKTDPELLIQASALAELGQ